MVFAHWLSEVTVLRFRELCSSPDGLPRALVVTEDAGVEAAEPPPAPPVPEEGDNFFSKASVGYGGFHSHGVMAGWFILRKMPSKWMMTRGTPILGNPHIQIIQSIQIWNLEMPITRWMVRQGEDRCLR